MERSVGYALLDNIIGFDDDHFTPGEKLKKAVGEDPIGVATTVVKGVGGLAKSAFDRVLEEGPLDALTGSLSDYSRELVGAGTRLKSGTQGYIDSGMTQAEARDKQISDALRLSELIPLMGSAATGLRAGRVALPEAPFDPSRRSFLGGIAALPAVAAIAPDALSGALKSVGPKVARATSSLDVSVAKIKDLLTQKDLLEQQSDTLRMDSSFDNRNAISQESVKKDRESFQVQDEIEQTAVRALDDLTPTDLSNAADDSIEMIAEQFSKSGVLEAELDTASVEKAFEALMEQVKLRGMNNAKDSKGIDQFPYARDIYEDYYNPIRNDGGAFSSSVFKAPQGLNMVEGAPPVGRTVAPDIVEKIKDLNISRVLQKMELEERKMIVEGKSVSEIDAMKAELRQELYKLQNEGTEDFSKDFFADGGAVMNGVGSLSETARNMTRGPRGLNSLQRFADGGPVTSMRPRSRPTNDETEAEQLAASSEAFGDNELLADLMPILQNDPLAMLGYDPKIMRFDQPIGSSRAFYDPRSDTIHYGADYGSSFEVIVHELRHRGTQILRNQALKNPENFKERYGTAAYNFTSGLKGRTEANINQNSEQITNFGDKGTDEWINELLDNPDNFVYNAPFINEDGSTGSERVNDSYVVEYADKDALRSFRKTGEYPESGRGPEGRYGSIGVPRRGLVRDRRGFGNTTTEYLNMTPYEKSKLITREYNLPRFTDQINPSEITKGISGMKQAATDLLQGQKEDGIFYADGGEVMNGIGSLNETARGMSRGPRGIGAYQQFAEGGELNVDLQPLDLPVDGRMSYTQTDDGGRFDSEIRKTFEGGLGSLTPSFDYSTQNSSRNMGDVVIDENGEQIGFAVEGELFLNSDPNSEDKVRGAFEVEKSRNNTNFTFPEGEFVRTDEGLFKRFNLGMDLGKFGLDLNRMEGSGRDPVNSGSATIRIGENGIVRYSDSDRGEPTIGFNYAKEFADGGPVYMAGGGSLSRYTELRDGNKQNTFTALQGVDAERLKRQRGYYERGPDALGSNIYTGDTGSRLLLPAEDRPIIEDIAPISDVDVRDLPPPVMPTPVMPTPVMPTPFVPPPVMPTYDGSTISPMVSTPTMPTYDGSFPVMDREPFVMDRVPREVMYREPFVMDRREVRPREVMDPLVMDPAPLQPQPIASPAPSALNIGAGMSANDLQRMLARRSVGPTNLNEVNSSILSLQQAEVANRARRANVPPQRPYEPPPTGPSSPYGTPLTGPSSPYGPGSPYGPPPTGPGSPYGPPPTGPGSPYGPYGREVQPYGREVQPTSYGIGSFGQPMQQQGFGSNKPTANVLF